MVRSVRRTRPPGQHPDRAQRLLFIAVPEVKAVKNRLHLDLRRPEGLSLAAEAQRVIGLGAKQVADPRRADGGGGLTLADPEGDEFCILSSPEFSAPSPRPDLGRPVTSDL